MYLPTSSHSEEEVEEFYNALEELVEETPGNKYLVLMGDWNAIVGQGKDGKTTGEHGHGARNERGQKMIDFCKRTNLVVTNTLFSHPYR